MKPFIAVIIITNGKSPFLDEIASHWSKQYQPGVSLFFCGPKDNLLERCIPAQAIIEYIDPPHNGKYFHINHKKHYAASQVEAEYVLLAHDRFFPADDFKNGLEFQLKEARYDFGGISVINTDGSSALNKLCLKNEAINQPLDEALAKQGRLTCAASSKCASESIAVNGGVFFLHKSLIHFLGRPLRWFEMEDDVLSYDLRDYHGVWISEPKLISVVDRIAGQAMASTGTIFRYALYRWMCNVITMLLSIFDGRRHQYLSAGGVIDIETYRSMLKGSCRLIDPFHKATASEWLPSSLEKCMTRARIMTNGGKWASVQQTRLGWILS